MEAVTFNTHFSLLKLLNNFASTDDTRLSIQGVRIDLRPAGITAVATDGRMLIASEITGTINTLIGEGEGFTIPSELINSLKFHGPVSVSCYNTEGLIEIKSEDTGVIGLAKAVLPKYPDWRTVLPATLPANCAVRRMLFNPGYIAKATGALSQLAEEGAVAVDILSNDNEHDPIVLQIKHPFTRVVIMPMRVL